VENKPIKNPVTEEELKEALESIPEEKRNTIMSGIFAMVESRQFSGPLPAPEDFAKYEENLPGSAERILRMAEKQQEHRIESESKIIGYKTSVGKRGQWLGFILVILCIAASVMLGLFGHDWLAGCIGVTTVLGVAAVFVLGKEPNTKKNEQE
jgi:uncharacterized membrane protein